MFPEEYPGEDMGNFLSLASLPICSTPLISFRRIFARFPGEDKHDV